MNRIDTCKIKKITNQLIGYENFKMEEEMKSKKMRKLTFVFSGILLFGIGTITANALTDNKIVDTSKDFVTVKIISGNVEEVNNGTCKKLENGNYACTFKDTEDGEDKEITMEYSVNGANSNISIQYDYIED